MIGWGLAARVLTGSSRRLGIVQSPESQFGYGGNQVNDEDVSTS